MDITNLVKLYYTLSDGKWEAFVTHDGYMAIRIPRSPDIIFYDMEGADKIDSATVDFIVEMHNNFPEILSQLCGA